MRGVDESHDDAAQRAIVGPIRRNAAQERPSVQKLHIVLENLALARDDLRIGKRRHVARPVREMRNWSAEVAAGDVVNSLQGGREIFDPERLVEEEGGDLRAGKEVFKFVVAYLQGIVGVLDLFFRCFQLFVGGLQLFVHREQLFV